MTQGVAAGYPVVDIRVTLVDGKFHTVDSSDMAFQTAGALALKDAAAKTTINLLEPMVTLTVDVPDDHVGAVIADVSTRRGQIRGTDVAARRPLAGRGRRAGGGDLPLRDRHPQHHARHGRLHPGAGRLRARAGEPRQEADGG